jgi:integrase
MLKDKQIRDAERPSKLYDGNGLAIILPVSGRPYWRYDFRLHGKRRSMSLGIYPDVTLAMARTKLQEARTLVAGGHDPVRAKAVAKAAEKRTDAFSVLAEDWYQTRTAALAPKTRSKKRWVLDAFLLPGIGKIRLSDLKASDVLAVLRKLEADGLRETTRRVRQTAGEILRYGIATDRASVDVTTGLIDALEPMTVKHRASLTEPTQVAALMRAIGSLESDQLRAALRLLALTFVRPGELRGATWKEVDLAAKLWRIPAARTKQREDHLVPLSPQAVAEFKVLQAVSRGSLLVLPTPRTIQRPLSPAAFMAALARIGYPSTVMTPHGFRAMARTLLDEHLHEAPEVIEAQLGHVTPGPLGATYNRSRYLKQRKAMMDRWGSYLDEAGRLAVVSAR